MLQYTRTACTAAKSIRMHKNWRNRGTGRQTRIISANKVYKTSWIAFKRLCSKSCAPIYKNSLQSSKLNLHAQKLKKSGNQAPDPHYFFKYSLQNLLDSIWTNIKQVRCSNIQERPAKQQNQFAGTKIEEIGEPGARPALFLLKLCTKPLGQHLNEYQAS